MRNSDLLSRLLLITLAIGSSATRAVDAGDTYDAFVDTTLAKPGDANIDMLWKGFLSEREHDRVMDAYQVLNELAENVDARAACEQHFEALQQALRTVPVSLRLQHQAMQCADLLGKGELAKNSEALIAALVRHAVRNGRGRPFLQPIAVVYRSDANTLIEMLGYEPLHSTFRLDRAPEFRYLPLEVVAFDPVEKVEKSLEFDFLDVRMTLRRDEAEARFPSFRRELAEALIARYVELGDHAAQIGQMTVDLFNNDNVNGVDDLVRGYQALIDAGNDSARIALAEACLQARKPECMHGAVDALLPLVERRYGKAMVLLAAAYSLGVGVEADPKAVEILLRKAAQRMGVAASKRDFALALLTAGSEALGDTATSPEQIGQAIMKSMNAPAQAAMIDAANAGDPIAMLLAATMPSATKQPERREWLRTSADAGIGAAMYAMAKLELAGRNAAAADEWLEKAAAVDSADAQLELARRLAEQATQSQKPDLRVSQLLERAAHGGSGDAVIALAEMAVGAGDGALARQWLEGCPVFSALKCLFNLADLLEYGAPGLEADEATAMQLYDLLGQTQYPKAAWRATLIRLDSDDAAVLAQGREEITKMAEGGDLEAQFELALWLSRHEDEAGHIKWLSRCSDARSAACRGRLGQAYAQGWGVAADVAKARELLNFAATRGDVFAQNEIAWLLCAHAEASVRSPRLGLGWAEKAATASRIYAHVDTLAACHAASGEFKRAVEVQQEAIDLLKQDSDVAKEELAGAKDRMRLFRKKRVYIETPTAAR